MNKKRSFGVTVFGVLFLISALFHVAPIITSYIYIRKITSTQLNPPVAVKERIKEEKWEKLWEKLNEVGDKIVRHLRKETQKILPGRIVGGLVQLIIGISILKLENWGRKLALIFSFLGLIIIPFLLFKCANFYFSVNFPELKKLGIISIFVIILYFIFYISVLYFFTRPKVKEQFR